MNVLICFMFMMSNRKNNSDVIKKMIRIVVIILSMNSASCFASAVEPNEQNMKQASPMVFDLPTFDSLLARTSTPYYVYSAQVGERTFFTLSNQHNLSMNGLWEKRDDQGQNQMVLIKVFDHVGELTAVDNTLYFQGKNDEFGAELWKSDGTLTGTQLVKDINFGKAGSKPTYLLRFNQYVLFFAKDEQNKLNLWCSDGTSQGTVVVKHMQIRVNEEHFLDWNWSKLLFEVYQVVERRVYAVQKQSNGNVTFIEPATFDNAFESFPTVVDLNRY